MEGMIKMMSLLAIKNDNVTPRFIQLFGKKQFLQKIEQQETIDEKTGERTVDFVENPDTGGEFVVYNKNDNIKENNELGKLYLLQGKLYIVNNNTQNITPLATNTFEDLDKLRNTYNIYYIDKEKPDKLQPVYIKDEDNIQTDKGVVLSFKKIDLNNPNSELYLCGIYDGEFKEVTKEVINPETNEKTTETKNNLTGYANIFYQNGSILYSGSLKDNKIDGQGKWYDKNGTLRQEGTFKNDKLHGNDCTKYYEDGKTLKCVGRFNKGVFVEGKYYRKNGTLWQEGTFTNDNLNGQGKYYRPITIQHGEFKNNYLYSGSAHLRRDPEDKSMEQINLDNKIYTLDTDEDNNTRTLTFYGKAIEIRRDIQIHIDENNIAILRGEPLTEDETDKIKAFFNSIPIEQLQYFDDYLAILYYATIMNKKKYRDTNILIADLCKYDYKKGEEVDQTIDIMKNQIPQDKRKGKYIVPCGWLRLGHQVNLRIDFHNRVLEIVNTGDFIDETVINNLQTALREQFKGEEWIVCENNIMRQSTGNCVIASNIVATEKTVVEKKTEDYNKKIKQLEKVDKKIENIKEQKDKEKDLGQQQKSVTNLKSKFTNQIKIQELENEIQELQKKQQTTTGNINRLEKITNKTEQQEQELQQLQQDKILKENKIKELQNELDILKNPNKLKQKLQQLEQQKQQLKKELQELLNIIINNNKDKQTLTVEELEKQVQSFLIQYNDKIEQIVINELLYQDLGDEINKLKGERQKIISEEELLNELLRKQSIEERINIIRQDTERLQIEKENFVRYNLISKERLFNGCGKQFDREASEDIVNEGNGIKIPGQM